MAAGALARVIARALVAASLLVLAACGAHRHAPVAEAPPLRIGTSGDYPPFSERAADGSWTGFDLEVARAYAEARGRRLEIVPFRWPELAARIAAGDVDVAMSGITVRADRLLVGTMTAAVARADAVVLVRGGDARAHGGIDRTGVRIAVNRGGHLERLARARLTRATLVPVDDNRRLPVMLTNGEVDAVVTDTREAATFPAGWAVAAVLAHDRKAYWAAPGREALAADLDAWLLERESDGYLPRLRLDRLHAPDAPGLVPELARLVDLLARRVMLMPDVAAAKRAAGMAIVDPAREAEVVARAVARARALGLDARAAEQLARAEIAAARAVQEATPADGTPRPADAPSPPTLPTLRAAIDALDATILHALVGAYATAENGGPLHTVMSLPLVSAALRADADVAGFDDAHADAIVRALGEILAIKILR